MIGNSVAYLDADGKAVLRTPQYRNRKDKLKVADVEIADDGRISHKPISKLGCFANPVEYHRGLTDCRPIYKGKVAAPTWCDGCPSRIACGVFSERRIEIDAVVAGKRKAWEVATQHLEGAEKYEHPTFTQFATASDERGWASDNDDNLAKQRADEAKRKRAARDNERRKAKSRKSVPPYALASLDDERNRRHEALVIAARTKGAPTWLRNLSDRMIALTCDVWQVLMVIERRCAGKVTSADVTRAVLALGRDHGIAEPSLRVRVNEAINRIGRLECEPTDAPVWAAFQPAQNPNSLRSPGQYLNGVVWQALEDDGKAD